jgi:hypothetical protein
VTVVREAITLPMVHLTVVLLAALRIGGSLSFELPSLFSLVLAALLLAALVQSGTVDSGRLVGMQRSGLERLSGTTVLAAVFAATASVLNLVTPSSGLPAVGLGCFLLVSLVLFLAAAVDRFRLLRLLAVLLGAAFVLKFIVLAALSTPAQGRLARALQVLFDGVTLGAVTQAEIGTDTGYVAFIAIVLYLIGIWMLPAAGWIIVRHDRPMPVRAPLLPDADGTVTERKPDN